MTTMLPRPLFAARMKRHRYALILFVALVVGVFAYVKWQTTDVEIKGLSQVKPGMTKKDALVLLGTPVRQQNTVMTGGIYGVPPHIENKIGQGNPFEMWSFEQAIPSKTVYATVWLIPDSSPAVQSEMRVLDVTTQVVRRSPRFLLLQWISKTFPSLALD